MPSPCRIPVILDTDIGTDIDDIWALAMLLKSPRLEVRLITAATQDTWYRARLIARLLELAGCTYVPIGVGPMGAGPGRWQLLQEPWVEGYQIEDYPGPVHQDGVDAIVQEIMRSEKTVTVIAIGPLTNIAAALDREPAISRRARFVGMHGSLRRSHHRGGRAVAEYNVHQDVPAAQAVFAQKWPKTITPLDTCALVTLDGELYQRVLRSHDPLCRAVIENYRVWAADKRSRGRHDPDAHSSILFDTVAVYLACEENYLVMEELNLRVGDDGFTRVDPGGEPTRCATEWRDLDRFKQILVTRLLGPVTQGPTC